MPPYATAADVVAYALDSGVTVPTGAAVERLIARAERDLDRVIGPYRRLPDGRKLDPSSLTDAQRDALSRATAAQVCHRLVMTEPFFAEGEDLAPDNLRVLRPAERVTIRAREELAGHDLITRSGTLPPPDPLPAA